MVGSEYIRIRPSGLRRDLENKSDLPLNSSNGHPQYSLTKSEKRSDGFGEHLSRAAVEEQASQNQGSGTRIANAISQQAKCRYESACISCDLKGDAGKASRCR